MASLPVLLGTTAVASAIGGMAWAVRGRASQVFGPSIHRGDPSRPALALTFDDGPSPSTLRLLETLAKRGVPATFFMVGANVRRRPDIAREVAQAGHELGNHSDTHPYFHFKNASFMESQLRAAQQSIEDATGQTPAWFRAPYGVRWFGLAQAQHALQLKGAMWTVLGRDWTLPAAGIVRRLADHATHGGIFCLHDGRELDPSPDISQTIAAVADAVPRLQDRGYEFVTLSDICRKSN